MAAHHGSVNSALKLVSSNTFSNFRYYKPTLLLKHSGGWKNDRCEQWLKSHGFATETIVNADGIQLPDARNYARIIIYGGVPCISDKAYKECLNREMRFIENALDHDIPCFGICLGAQLIAHVLGAAVKPLPCGSTETGFSRITPTHNGLAFMPQPCKMLQWHCEGFDLPTDCTLLATSDKFPNQAFKYCNSTYGVQFHPEVTTEVLKVWHLNHKHNSRLGINVFQRFQQQHDCKKYARENDVWLEHFMQLWLSATTDKEHTSNTHLGIEQQSLASL